jgi:uncharacterized protein (TIGR02646 family)
MKHIEKQTPEPTELNNFLLWVQSKETDFQTLTGEQRWAKFHKKQNHKNKLQDVILEEQGYICAYCNRRIHKGLPETDEQLRIEHIEPKSTYPDKTFDYYNLVGACYGDQRENERTVPPRSLHCDVKKDDNEIPNGLFPTNINCETNILYDIEGMTSSKDNLIDTAINNILNLNCVKLVNDRKNVLFPLIEIETQEEAAIFISAYKEKDDNNQYRPYSGVVINFLKNLFDL